MKIRVARKKRDAYQHGDLREALIQAGLKLLAEGGVGGLGLRAAAQLAGVSHAAPYRHFRDKEALVAAIAERGFRLLAASMREELARAPAGDPRARLVALGAGYVRFGTEHPAYLHVIFGAGRAETAEPTPELHAAGEAAYGMLRDAVAAGVASGALRADPPDDLALACWALVHGLATLLVSRAVPPPPTAAARRALVERTINLIGRGIYGRA